jgi:ethanolaminephosphotransferase
MSHNVNANAYANLFENPNLNLMNLNLNNNYLSEEALENIKNFEYTSENKSITYNYITSPMLNKYILPLIPTWVAPNLITLLSFLFNFFTFIIILIECGNDYTKPLSRATCLLQAMSHFIYIILDNLDGKQARKTFSSSPLGLLFDHGFDTLTTWTVAFNVSHMVMTGNSGIYSLSIFYSLFLGFWVNVYEEYFTGKLNFGFVNGADEGNIVIASGALLSAIFGVEIWKIHFITISRINLNLNISQFMIILLTIGSLQNIFQCVYNVYFFRKKINDVFTFFSDSFKFGVLLFLPIVTAYYDPEFFEKNFTLIMLLFSMTFTRLIFEMQVNIIASQKVKPNFIVSFTHLIYWNMIYFLKDRDSEFTGFRIIKNLRRDYVLVLLIIVNLVYYWGLGIGDWGLGIGPNPQSPIPNPQSPIPHLSP